MLKLLFCFILICGVMYGNNGINDNDDEVAQNKEMNYPLFEISGGLGLVWLLQLNCTVSPAPHFYFQPRFSSAIIAHEAGFVAGFQNKYKEDTILRLGIGFSKGKAVPFGPSSSQGDDWESLYLRFGVLGKWKENMIINPNLNVTRLGGRAILSGNVAVGYCIFRK